MKTLLRQLTIILIVSPFLAFNAGKPTRVIFFGDSITQAGTGPVGYITQLGDILKARGVADQFELIGAGRSGNKVYDLYLRMEDDVLAPKPDVVFIYVGINDVWHKTTQGTGTDPEKYIRFYQAIIAKLKARNVRVILCTPTVIGERADFSNPQDGDLNYYAGMVRELAAEEGVELCDLRKEFVDFLVDHNPNNRERNILTTDRVHLNEMGNKLVAEAMTKVLLKK